MKSIEKKRSIAPPQEKSMNLPRIAADRPTRGETTRKARSVNALKKPQTGSKHKTDKSEN